MGCRAIQTPSRARRTTLLGREASPFSKTTQGRRQHDADRRLSLAQPGMWHGAFCRLQHTAAHGACSGFQGACKEMRLEVSNITSIVWKVLFSP